MEGVEERRSMKTAASIAKKMRDEWVNTANHLCEYIMAPHGPKKVGTPFYALDHECEWCGNSQHYLPLFDPNISAARMWLCAKTDCVTYTTKKNEVATYTLPPSHRAILWPLFCEYNGIGDVHHAVCFEKVEQNQKKVDFMLKFCSQPTGLLIMQGDPGTGKTYAAMAMCELFTRKSAAAGFITQKQMVNKWLASFHDENKQAYGSRLETLSLLVIDDFGIGEIPPGFLSFFMDLINSRMQWTNKGTVITTNLKDKEFNRFCGEALADRLMTGQNFTFEGTSRRKKVIL